MKEKVGVNKLAEHLNKRIKFKKQKIKVKNKRLALHLTSITN